MKTVFKLFAYEFKNIYKQALIFAFISTFLFALSISVMCFSSDMVQGYKDYLDEDGYYTSISIYDVNVLDKYNEVNSLCDYLSVHAYGICENIENTEGDEHSALITYRPMLQKDGLTSGYHGRSYIFRDELPREIDEEYFLEEGEFGSVYNEKNSDGYYSIYISAKVAEELEAKVGDIITLNYVLTNGEHTEEFTVAGVYRLKEENNSSYRFHFLIPFNFVNENVMFLTTNDYDFYEGYSYFLQLNRPSDIMDILPKIRALRIGSVGLGLSSGEEIDLVNIMRYVLIAVAVAIVIVTFVVLSNSLTITVNSRKKFMARLKLLGATTDKITAAYFILLVASFILSFALSILLSYLLCGYFTAIAVAALEYKVSMNLHWGAVGILFAVGCALLAVRYVLFRLKVKKVSPAEFIKEE